MKYIEVATLRENLLEMVRGGAAMADIEWVLKEYSDAIWAQAIEAHAKSESDVIAKADPAKTTIKKATEMKNPYQEKTARWWFHEYLPQPWRREAILAAKLFPIHPIGVDGSEKIFDALEDALATGFKWNETDEELGTENDRWRYWNRIMSLYNEDRADTTSIAESFIVHRPEQSNHRAELIQLTAAALSGAIIAEGRNRTCEDVAEYALNCAEAALKIINQKNL